MSVAPGPGPTPPPNWFDREDAPTRPVGPYVREPGFGAPPPRPGAANLGACP